MQTIEDASSLPVCTYCSAVDRDGKPYSSRLWVAGGERHAAVSHAATVLVATDGITRDEARERLGIPR